MKEKVIFQSKLYNNNKKKKEEDEENCMASSPTMNDFYSITLPMASRNKKKLCRNLNEFSMRFIISVLPQMV